MFPVPELDTMLDNSEVCLDFPRPKTDGIAERGHKPMKAIVFASLPKSPKFGELRSCSVSSRLGRQGANHTGNQQRQHRPQPVWLNAIQFPDLLVFH
jgi:hypothetical protein